MYLFDIPYQLSVSGPHAEQVLGTFTNSGFQRVLGRGPQASLGTSRLIPSCAPQIDFDLVPGDGLWIRSTADSQSQPDGTQIAHGVVDGLDVTVAAMHRTVAGAPSPALDLVVRDGSATPIWVSLGVGTDTSIARSILRSLHAVRGGP